MGGPRKTLGAAGARVKEPHRGRRGPARLETSLHAPRRRRSGRAGQSPGPRLSCRQQPSPAALPQQRGLPCGSPHRTRGSTRPLPPGDTSCGSMTTTRGVCPAGSSCAAALPPAPRRRPLPCGGNCSTRTRPSPPARRPPRCPRSPSSSVRTRWPNCCASRWRTAREFAEVYAEYAINTGFALDERRCKTAQYGVLSGRRRARHRRRPDRLRLRRRVRHGRPARGRARRRRASRASGRPAAPPRRSRVSKAPAAVHARARRAADARPRSEQDRAAAAAPTTPPAAHDRRIAAGPDRLARTIQRARSWSPTAEGVWAEDRQFVSRLACVQALAHRRRATARAASPSAGGAVEADYFDKARTPEEIGARGRRASRVDAAGGGRPEGRRLPGGDRPRAGAACWCTSASATRSRATASARRPRSAPASSASRSCRDVRDIWTTRTRAAHAAARSRSTTRARRRREPCWSRTACSWATCGTASTRGSPATGPPATAGATRTATSRFPRMTNTYIDAGTARARGAHRLGQARALLQEPRRRLGQPGRRQLLASRSPRRTRSRTASWRAGAQRHAHRQRRRRDAARSTASATTCAIDGGTGIVRQGRAVEAGRRRASPRCEFTEITVGGTAGVSTTRDDARRHWPRARAAAGSARGRRRRPTPTPARGRAARSRVDVHERQASSTLKQARHAAASACACSSTSAVGFVCTTDLAPRRARRTWRAARWRWRSSRDAPTIRRRLPARGPPTAARRRARARRSAIPRSPGCTPEHKIDWRCDSRRSRSPTTRASTRTDGCTRADRRASARPVRSANGTARCAAARHRHVGAVRQCRSPTTATASSSRAATATFERSLDRRSRARGDRPGGRARARWRASARARCPPRGCRW